MLIKFYLNPDILQIFEHKGCTSLASDAESQSFAVKVTGVRDVKVRVSKVGSARSHQRRSLDLTTHGVLEASAVNVGCQPAKCSKQFTPPSKAAKILSGDESESNEK